MKKIVIIGGGFSGTMLALHLSSLSRTHEIHIVEPRDTLGLGVAYSTDEPGHLLNIAASDMSAWPDRPHDFVGYLVDTNEGLAHLPVEYFKTYYAPRMIFGRYIQSLVMRPEHANIIHHQTIATRIRRSEYGLELSLGDHRVLDADHVVLALGLAPSASMDRIFGWSCPGRYLSNAWDMSATREFMTALKADDRVLIIGSGLTMLDMLISLEQHGVKGPVSVVSRHGFCPQVHAPYEHIELLAQNLSPREWLKLFRQHKSNWRAVFDAIKPFTKTLWHNLSQTHKAQFLRHLKAHWNAHRHRIAPEVQRFLSYGLNSKRITMHKGRLVKAESSTHGFKVNFQHKEEIFSLSAERVINCTGPESQFSNYKGSLFAGLLKDGLVTHDHIGLGIKSTADFKAVQQNGYEPSSLYILGALRRGNDWESTTVPELRSQAYELARIFTS